MTFVVIARPFVVQKYADYYLECNDVNSHSLYKIPKENNQQVAHINKLLCEKTSSKS